MLWQARAHYEIPALTLFGRNFSLLIFEFPERRSRIRNLVNMLKKIPALCVAQAGNSGRQYASRKPGTQNSANVFRHRHRHFLSRCAVRENGEELALFVHQVSER